LPPILPDGGPAAEKGAQAATKQEGEAMNSIPTGRYRHYKGKEYSVLGVARHSETQEEFVVYRQEHGDRSLWVRPKEMFLETVLVDGRKVARFQDLSSEAEED
jgi:hypothetical protein